MSESIRKLSTTFEEDKFDNLCRQSGRHYIIAPDGRLMKMSSDNGEAFLLHVNEVEEMKDAIEAQRTTKIIFPKSSSKAINRFLGNTGRYIQRSNNTSMSIRDYVESKGRSGHSMKKAVRDDPVDIRGWV